MVLNELTLENFGPYRHKQSFELTPRQRHKKVRPIILFGGKNGAGKTTIFDAVNLCLYGQDAIGPGAARKDYFDYIAGKIHKSANREAPIDETSVTLAFTHVHAGKQCEYLVRRSWNNKKKNVEEDLSILQNGQPLSTLESDQWNTFLKELVPPGVAQLFFFDGEKIRRLSDENPLSQVYFVESVKSLMGVDLIEKLDKDIGVYSRRHIGKDDKKSLAGEFDRLSKEKEALKVKRKEHRQDRAQLENGIRRKKSQIRAEEERMKNAGAEFYQKHDELKARTALLASKIARHEDQIREMCTGLFPFSLCGDLCRQLTQRLGAEAELSGRRQYKTQLREHISRLAREMEIDARADLLPIAGEFDVSALSAYMKRKSLDLLGEPDAGSETLLIDELAPKDVENIRFWTGPAMDESQRKISRYCDELDALNEELAKVELNLSRAPSEDSLKPYFESISRLNQELGGLEKEGKILDEKIAGISERMNQIEIRLAKINETMADIKKSSERMKLAVRTKNALAKFTDRVMAAKIGQIEESIGTYFKQLCHKDDLIENVRVDPEWFSIALFDKHGNEIQKKRLSSGERQIFAIAMLRALRDVSGRPIPVIIDTPLSRLDSEHRNNLIYDYFPFASHQTIILSTDTEINNGFYDGLKDHVSHSYFLNFFEKENRTEGEPGYFRKDVQKRRTNESE